MLFLFRFFGRPQSRYWIVCFPSPPPIPSQTKGANLVTGRDKRICSGELESSSLCLLFPWGLGWRRALLPLPPPNTRGLPGLLSLFGLVFVESFFSACLPGKVLPSHSTYSHGLLTRRTVYSSSVCFLSWVQPLLRLMPFFP